MDGPGGGRGAGEGRGLTRGATGRGAGGGAALAVVMSPLARRSCLDATNSASACFFFLRRIQKNTAKATKARPPTEHTTGTTIVVTELLPLDSGAGGEGGEGGGGAGVPYTTAGGE